MGDKGQTGVGVTVTQLGGGRRPFTVTIGLGVARASLMVEEE